MIIPPQSQELLQQIISKLERGSSPDSKWPDLQGEFWAQCPFHPDNHSSNFSVSTEGFNCYTCGEKGSLAELSERLNWEEPKVQAANSASGLSLKDYSQAKKLPIEFLKELGIHQRNQGGIPGLVIPYFDVQGDESAKRYRFTLNGNRHYRWAKGSKIIPYGLWRLKNVLQCCAENGRVQREIFLVRDESDCHMLWFHNINALGIPGATIWKSEWSKYLEGYDVYIWWQPDEGGGMLVESIGKDFLEAKVLMPPPNRKDISECHTRGDDITTLLHDMKAVAKTIREIQNEQRQVNVEEIEKAAESLLKGQHILDDMVGLCREFGLVGEERNAKLIYLALTSRLLEKPINLVIKGQSSGGKSFTLETVLKIFPETAYYALTSMSEHALIYFEEPMSHRYLIIFEASGVASDLTDYFIRSLISEGRIRYLVAGKTADGNIKDREIVIPGPTGLIQTTTRANLHSENETRMMSLAIIDDPNQTRNILLALADRANGSQQRKPDIRPWHALQIWLEMTGKRDVLIPYATFLAQHTNPSAVRMRRDFETVLDYIRAHAILHQRHRETDERGCIIATTEDYRVVYDLMFDLVSEGVGLSVKKTIRETVEVIRKLVASKTIKEISYEELKKALKLHKSTVSRRVCEAIELGYLVNNEDGRGKLARVSLGISLPDDDTALPTPQELEIYLSHIPPDNAATAQHLFTPSSEWQEIPADVPIPPGGEFRMDMATGKNYGRWPNLNSRFAEEQSPTSGYKEQSPKQTSWEEMVRSSPYPDTSKPCYACGDTNWKLHEDGKTIFCGTCHPTRKEEEK